MRYELLAIASYAGKIAQLTKTSFRTDKNWGAQQGDVLRFAEELSRNSSKASLGNYAAALHNAAAYLNWRKGLGNRVSSDRQDFIEGHFEALKSAYLRNYPEGKIKAPLLIVQPTALQSPSLQGFSGSAKALRVKGEQRRLKEAGLAHAPALNNFVASAQFRALQDYLDNTLTDDNRSHSYLCGLINFHEGRKAKVLQQLIVDIKSSRSMDEVKGILSQFYSEKETMLSNDGRRTWHSSRFDILNTGQNISTRFFSVFGKQTTTINLIDSLATSIGVNPEQAAKTNQCASHNS